MTADVTLVVKYNLSYTKHLLPPVVNAVSSSLGCRWVLVEVGLELGLHTLQVAF